MTYLAALYAAHPIFTSILLVEATALVALILVWCWLLSGHVPITGGGE